MTVEQSARSVSHTEGVDQVRVLQRVLYRSAKQDSARRFHALYDKVARSLDSVTITSIGQLRGSARSGPRSRRWKRSG